VVAQTTDFAAAFYNPAGMAWGHGKEVSLGALGIASHLQIQGTPQSIEDPAAGEAGFDADLPLKGWVGENVRFGLALFLLPNDIVRVISHTPDAPFFPYYDNRTQRLVILPAVAARITQNLSVGVAVNFLAGLAGNIDSAEGPARAVDPRADQEIGSIARANVGVSWQVLPSLRLGAVYRQAFAVPFSESSKNTVAGANLDLAIAAQGLYTPDEVAAGAAWHPDWWDGRVILEDDVQWSRWSGWRGPYVDVSSQLPLVGSLQGTLPNLKYSDAWADRLGAVANIWERGGPDVPTAVHQTLLARAGVGFETSPIPSSQPGESNLIDGNKILLSAGLGFNLENLLPKPVRIDVFVAAQIVTSNTLFKRFAAPGSDPAAGLQDEQPSVPGLQTTNPGYPSITGGGVIYNAGACLTVGL
jgi:long-subunit fatty acid transport protein